MYFHCVCVLQKLSWSIMFVSGWKNGTTCPSGSRPFERRLCQTDLCLWEDKKVKAAFSFPLLSISCPLASRFRNGFQSLFNNRNQITSGLRVVKQRTDGELRETGDFVCLYLLYTHCLVACCSLSILLILFRSNWVEPNGSQRAGRESGSRGNDRQYTTHMVIRFGCIVKRVAVIYAYAVEKSEEDFVVRVMSIHRVSSPYTSLCWITARQSLNAVAVAVCQRHPLGIDIRDATYTEQQELRSIRQLFPRHKQSFSPSLSLWVVMCIECEGERDWIHDYQMSYDESATLYALLTAITAVLFRRTTTAAGK